MEKYTYILSKQDQKRIFLKGYWRHPVRKIGFFVIAPALCLLSFIIAINSIAAGNSARIFFELFAAGFGMCVAVIFWIFPLLLMLKNKFSGRKILLKIDEKQLELSENKSTIKVTGNKIKKVQIQGNYLYVQADFPGRKNILIDTSLIEPQNNNFAVLLMKLVNNIENKNE